MKLLNFTIIKLTLCLIAGIILSNFLEVLTTVIIYSCLTLLVLLLISLLISRNQLQKTMWFGLIAYIIMISIGVLNVNLHDQTQFKNHYSKVVSADIETPQLITFKIREVLKPTFYQDKYIVEILKINETSASGKLLLNVQTDSLVKPLQVDDIVITSTLLSPISMPLNPFQFDYKGYLQKRYINHQASVEHQELLKVRSEPFTIYGYAAIFRSKIDEKLKSYHFESQELAIIDALLLGQRKDISQDTYNNYVNAGAIHILAVSGLHVGIILFMLQWLFRPLERLKHGNIIRFICIAIILWAFAIVAGLSPSVTRAVSMFTIIAIGINLKRPTNIINTLAISMLFLLLFKPMFLYDVGFQMSYAAVFSIATIQPMLVNLWTPRIKLVNYYWKLICVTTAAQIGVVPISLFYFHQFPGLFFLSNVVILPFLGFILGFGIVVIFMALLNILPQFVADFYGLCISYMNNFISWVSQQERFVLRDISFGILYLVVSYLMIIALFAYFKKPKYQRLVFVFVAFLMIQGAMIFQRQQLNTNAFIIFHKSKFSQIGIKENESLKVSDNLDSLSRTRDNTIRNYRVGMSIENIQTMKLASVYQFNSELLLVVDSLGIYNVKSFKPDYVLLRNSPKMNLNRLIDSLKPKLIITDGSNYKSYVERWKATCDERKIPFHMTYEKGAFVVDY